MHVYLIAQLIEATSRTNLWNMDMVRSRIIICWLHFQFVVESCDLFISLYETG